jgi:hypothetical protein
VADSARGVLRARCAFDQRAFAADSRSQAVLLIQVEKVVAVYGASGARDHDDQIDVRGACWNQDVIKLIVAGAVHIGNLLPLMRQIKQVRSGDRAHIGPDVRDGIGVLGNIAHGRDEGPLEGFIIQYDGSHLSAQRSRAQLRGPERSDACVCNPELDGVRGSKCR